MQMFILYFTENLNVENLHGIQNECKISKATQHIMIFI